MKTVIGLDLGTNSIGWSLIQTNIDDVQKGNVATKEGKILGIGSRIIPMDGDAMSKFESGNPVSKTADRRQARGTRRLLQRYRLRRSRLIKTLQILGWIPENFPVNFDMVEKFNINDFLPFSEATKTEAYSKYKEAGAINESEKISTDWLIYYLRTKALTQKITLAELARILYHFNQRRGYDNKREKQEKNSNSIEDENEENNVVEKIEILKVNSIVEIQKNKNYNTYQCNLSSPTCIYEKALLNKKTLPTDWIGEEFEFEITQTYPIKNKKILWDEEPKTTIRIFDRSNAQKQYKKLKASQEKYFEERNEKTIGQCYFEELLKDKSFRIKDRLVDRKRYKDELSKILDIQNDFYKGELLIPPQIPTIAETLYQHNAEKQKELKANDLKHLIMNDIIYYQRDLKSQKHLIAECPYEKKNYTDPVTKKQKAEKVTPKSSPVFQEFRIWQTIHNLKIYQKEQIVNGKVKTNLDVTGQYLIPENKVKLFQLLDSKAAVSDKAILDELGFKRDKIENGEKVHSFRLNYPPDTEFKGNETKALFRKVFGKHQFDGNAIINDARKLHLLWHIVYSLKDENHVYNAVKKQFQLPDELARHISKLPEFKNEYASFSSKAIHKLLPLMRCASYWQESKIHEQSRQRIGHLLNGEVDENINLKTREEIEKRNFKTIADFQGLPTYLSCYIVYGRHSERENEEKFKNLETFLEKFNVMKVLSYNSLRNPIVEQITREALSVVKDICIHYSLLPDEIHVELGRDLKKNNEERRKITEAQTKNKVERDRIVSILKELKIGNSQSPADIEKFQIWKDTGGKLAKEMFYGLFKNSKETNPLSDKLTEYQKLYFDENEYNHEPKKAEIEKYKLWEEQNYISPYTGRIIPLSKLFTSEYEVEHIIPKARFFDDSIANKTICEAEVNKQKDRMLGMEYIEENGGKEVVLSNGQKIRILTVTEYVAHIDKTFTGKKKRHFKLTEVPDEFVTRQINDTRYISRTVALFLYPVAKDDDGIVFTNGAITSTLKESWGLHKKWKEILRPRFERLEKITGETLIDLDNEHNDIHFKKDYKRIDHRHHALDALVIACTDRTHIKYLNTLEAFNSGKEDWGKYFYLLKRSNQKAGEKPKMREFDQPWSTFTTDAYNALQSIIVSHKNNKQLVTKTINRYKTWLEEEQKIGYAYQQTPKDDKYWVAVRKSMFAQPLGQILLPEFKKEVKIAAAIKIEIEFVKAYIQKGKTANWKSESWRIAQSKFRKEIDKLIVAHNYDEAAILKHIKQNPIKDENGAVIENADLLRFQKFASKRVSLDGSFTEDKIKNMPYANHPKNWLTKLLKDHLAEYQNDPKQAFTGENLEQLYKKSPFPINKVTRKESGEKMFVKGQFVEGDKGTNMFFIIEEEMTTGTKGFFTPNLNDVIKRLASNLPMLDEKPGYKYTVLSPNDLVYVPTVDEIENRNKIDWQNVSPERIYKVVSFSDYQCFFVPNSTANPLIPADEMGANNKSESIWGDSGWERITDEKGKQTNLMIKKYCIKVKLDRLGKIIEADGKKIG